MVFKNHCTIHYNCFNIWPDHYNFIYKKCS